MITVRDPLTAFAYDPPQVAILPLACLEAHGPSLPVDIDRILIDEIARRVAQQLPYRAFLLPAWPYGSAPAQAGPPGAAVYLQAETLWSVVRDVARALFEHGIRQVAVLNNHGSCAEASALPSGNSIVKTAVRQLNYETPGLTAIWVQPFKVGRSRLEAIFHGAVQTETVEKAIAAYLMPASEQPHPAGREDGSMLSAREPGRLALEAVSLSTTEYIQATLSSLARIKEEHPS
jgi:creatinine amidohydrolase/Fe(II)-dependent formamide hydrolase-like protein